MAEHAGEKSHEATPHRRQQAREQGQTVYSQDLGSAALLVVGVSLLMAWGPRLVETSGTLIADQLERPHLVVADLGDVAAQSKVAVEAIAERLAPILLVIFAAGIASSVLQTGLLWLPERLQFDVARLSIFSGFHRIVSIRGAAHLFFGLFKVGIVAAVGGIVVAKRWNELMYCGSLATGPMAMFLGEVTLQTALWVGIALLILALLDYGFQRWRHEQDLRMTHQEIREEMKNLQGDPQVIMRRRQVQRQLALQRVGDKVPKADVVVTNPTELAVAIRYEPDAMAAPIVVAKGAGVLAQRIRRLALEHSVPIVERKPLAQLLYKQVDVNHPIPADAYAAVAEVLAYVYQLKGKKIPAMK